MLQAREFMKARIAFTTDFEKNCWQGLLRNLSGQCLELYHRSQASRHLCSPLLDLLQHLCITLVQGTPGLEAVLQMVSHQQRGTIPSLSLLDTPLLMQPMMHLACQAASAHCWLMFIFSFTRIPTSFFIGLLSMSLSPSR